MKKVLPFRNSLFTQISAVLIAITAVAFIGLFSFLQVTQDSTGKGSAINISGSLRMQSYVLALTAARSARLPEAQRTEEIGGALKEFERRLSSQGLTDAIPNDPKDELRKTYDAISGSYFSTIKPLAEEVIHSPETELTLFLDTIPSFVSKIDQFVLDLEKDLEIKTRQIRIGLSLLMLFALLLFIFVRVYLRRILFDPLEELSSLSSSVRAGDFSRRSSYRKDNEIGNLSDSMNFMIEDLSRLYTNLEEEVKEKTADLNLQKDAIQLLYDLKNILFTAQLEREHLDKALLLITKRLDACSAALGLRSAGSDTLRFIAEADQTNYPPVQSFDIKLNEVLKKEYSILHFLRDEQKYTLACIPADINTTQLTLLILFKEDANVRVDREFTKNLGQEFAQAIDNSQKSVESRRLALFEERSTIARELHDSIAQSLAFSRIQIARLSTELHKETVSPEVESILDELKLGVQTAYQQLRSVLTTFRLKPKSSDLKQNILSILDEFKERDGFHYTTDVELQSFELDANKQIHLLQILREALTNIEKHARADQVFVTLRPIASGKFRLVVRDNGCGIKGVKKEGHYGLEIMHERTRILGGVISIEPAVPNGTQVVVDFTP